MELQKKNPPFGGFETVPVRTLRRIYVSPGPIHEPGETNYEEIAWAQAMIAAGFRPGDIAVNTFSYHMVPFALHMVDNTLYKIGCITIPTGVGNTEQQVHILKNLKANAFCGTPSFLLNLAEKAEEMGLDLKKDLTPPGRFCGCGDVARVPALQIGGKIRHDDPPELWNGGYRLPGLRMHGEERDASSG